MSTTNPHQVSTTNPHQDSPPQDQSLVTHLYKKKKGSKKKKGLGFKELCDLVTKNEEQDDSSSLILSTTTQKTTNKIRHGKTNYNDLQQEINEKNSELQQLNEKQEALSLELKETKKTIKKTKPQQYCNSMGYSNSSSKKINAKLKSQDSTNIKFETLMTQLSENGEQISKLEKEIQKLTIRKDKMKKIEDKQKTCFVLDDDTADTDLPYSITTTPTTQSTSDNAAAAAASSTLDASQTTSKAKQSDMVYKKTESTMCIVDLTESRCSFPENRDESSEQEGSDTNLEDRDSPDYNSNHTAVAEGTVQPSNVTSYLLTNTLRRGKVNIEISHK